MGYKNGDQLILRIQEDFGYKEKKYRQASVTVISDVSTSTDDPRYMCYVPCYENVPGSYTITERHLKWHNIPKKFLGEQACTVSWLTDVFKHIPAPASEQCDRCKEPIMGAVRGEDGAFRCRACRENPWR